jgi:hypothetical protein
MSHHISVTLITYKLSHSGVTAYAFFYNYNMDPSLRIVPANGPKSTSLNKDTTNSFGLHDTLQYGTRSIAQEVKQDGVIRQRLESVSPFPLLIT